MLDFELRRILLPRPDSPVECVNFCALNLIVVARRVCVGAVRLQCERAFAPVYSLIDIHAAGSTITLCCPATAGELEYRLQAARRLKFASAGWVEPCEARRKRTPS